jgi:hypothetical protein
MSGAIPLHPLYAFVVWTGTVLRIFNFCVGAETTAIGVQPVPVCRRAEQTSCALTWTNFSDQKIFDARWTDPD